MNEPVRPERRARVERKTKESDIVVELDLDGTGQVSVDTGVPFFDHMLTSLGSHASFDLTIKATGDIEIEGHQANVLKQSVHECVLVCSAGASGLRSLAYPKAGKFTQPADAKRQ